MVKPKKAKNSSDREKWTKVFNALVHMLTSQQTQLESLAKERMILEDRIKLQHDRWVSDIDSFKEQIYEMKKDFTVQEMERMLEVAKSEFVVGLKQRDVVMFKRKFEDADSELADFREWFDYLSHKCSEPNDTPRIATNEKAETKKKAWEDEAFTRNIEELRSSNTNKDNTIATLRSQMAQLESDSVTKGEEISKLSTELALLKKSGSASVTPVLRRSTAGSGPSKLGGTSRGRDQRNITVKEEKQSSQALQKGQRSSKRKAGNSILDAPNLFTSSFKVPKLKFSSPCVT